MTVFYKQLFSNQNLPVAARQTWIINTLTKAYNDYQHLKGQKVPSERALARFLGFSSRTVQKAYHKLKLEGLLCSTKRRETTFTVSSDKRGIMENQFSGQWPFGSWKTERPIDLPAESERQNIMMLGVDSPGVDAHIENMVQGAKIRAKLRIKESNFSPKEIAAILKSNLVKDFKSRRGIRVLKSQIAISSRGNGLDIIAKCLVKKGDKVAVIGAAYDKAVGVFSGAGANVLPIPLAEDGLISSLKEICKLNRLKVLYIAPEGYTPFCTSLSEEVRQQIVMLAKKFGFCVITSETNFEFVRRQSIPAMAQLFHEGHLIHLSTVSKIHPDFERYHVIAAMPEFIRQIERETGRDKDSRDLVLESALAELLNTLKE